MKYQIEVSIGFVILYNAKIMKTNNLILGLTLTLLLTSVSFGQEAVETPAETAILEGISAKTEEIITVNEEDAGAMTETVIAAIQNALEEEPAKKAILEAEFHYKKALEAFKTGNTKDTKKHFDKFKDTLAKANIDPGLYFFLFDDYENILNKLKRIYAIDTPIPELEAPQTSIAMECDDNTAVERYIGMYSSGVWKNDMRVSLERSGAYKAMILKNLQDFGLPQELFYLPIVESRFSNRDVSTAGAVGLWQIMSHRGRALGLQINYWIDERRDPEKATKAACLYLKQLYLMLNDWHLVLAAYNRGEYGLIRDMRFSNATNITQMTTRNAIPKETQRYVPQFIAVVTIAGDLEKHGFKNLNFAAPLQYDVIKTDKVIDLKIAAECAETTVEEIKSLNPALLAWCTPHGYPGFELKIPAGTKEKFIENIAKVKDLNPSPGYIKYKVVKGDYLGKIAKAYKTTESAIKEDNPQLKRQKYLQLNQVLTIRPGRAYFSK